MCYRQYTPFRIRCRKSSELGYAIAIYLSGDEGIIADPTEADKWFQKAREQGFSNSPISSKYLKFTEV
jgi:TPR repeat protein